MEHVRVLSTKYQYYYRLNLDNFGLQLAILEAEQKAEEEEGPETSFKKRGKKKNKNLAIKQFKLTIWAVKDV